MKTLTVRVPDALHAKLESMAAQRGKNKYALVCAALEELVDSGFKTSPGSCLDLAQDLVGSGTGPRDLSHDEKHPKRYGR